MCRGVGKNAAAAAGAAVFIISFPLVTSLLLRTYGWLNLLPLGWRGTLGGVALVLTFNYLPFMLLPLVKAFERADQTLMQAVLDLGDAGASVLASHTFRSRFRRMSGAAPCFHSRQRRISHSAFHRRRHGQCRRHAGDRLVRAPAWPYAAACAAWLAGLCSFRLWDRWFGRRGRRSGGLSFKFHVSRFKLALMQRYFARGLGITALGSSVAGMYLPVLMTFVYSFNASRIGTVWTGFSLGGYGELFQRTELWRWLGKLRDRCGSQHDFRRCRHDGGAWGGRWRPEREQWLNRFWRCRW